MLRIPRLLTALCCLGLLVSAEEPSLTTDLILNGGFEEDDYNLRGEVMSCPVRQRATYGQKDGLPDRWNFIGKLTHPDTAKYLERTKDRHSGLYAVQLKPAQGHRLNQSYIYAIQTKGQNALPPLHFSAWVKGAGDKNSLTAHLSLQISVQDPKTKKHRATAIHTVKKEFPAPADWAEIAFDVSSQDLLAALKDRAQPVGSISGSLALEASKDSPAVLIDDVALSCADTPAPYTLVPNAGFESVDGEDHPKQWSQVKKSLRFFGSNYYVWRDWYHFFSVPRGANGTDDLVVRTGKRSFRMNVPPGDDKHLESAPIVLDQSQPGRMVIQFDYNCYLLANLMVQVVDGEGREVFARNVVAGTTQGWRKFQAEFVPQKAGLKAGDVRTGADLYGAAGGGIALKSCRVRIGVKGVNGSEMDDINEWVNVNHAGVLWLDNVVLAETEATARELSARGLRTYKIGTKLPKLAVERIDLGERLYGGNEATVVLANHGKRQADGTLTMRISGPFREDDPKKAGYAMGAAGQDKLEPPPPRMADQVVPAEFSVAPGGRTVLALPYTITQLLKDWRSEYRVSVSLGKTRMTELSFGTWSQQARVEVQKCYAFAEDQTQSVFMNIGVGRKPLRRVERLRLDVRRARDDGPVLTRDIPDFQKAFQGFGLSALPDGYQTDGTNFLETQFPLGQLPVHPQTRPVRDHYVAISGLDANGNVVFQGRSPRFGRMERHNEKLDPITEVKIHEDNYLLVNGKPFFTRGHIWMQQNFGPSPLARKNTDWKPYGFNVKAGTQSPFADESNDRYGIGMQQVWNDHQTYVGSQMISAKGPMNDEIRADITKWIAKPYIIGIHFIPWEGAPHGKPEESLQYAKQIRALKGTRPLWVSSGWYAPAVSGRLWPANLENDWFMPENNAYFQPSQLDKSVLPLKRARGEPCVLGTYPNVFNDTPWRVQRFEHWTEIIRRHTGYMQIGKPGDPTLMAGQNGEFRFIESFLFSKEKAPRVAVSPNVEHLVRTTGDATYIMATNAGPVIGGDWEWSTETRDQGRASHTGAALWDRLHDYMKDTYVHFYKDDQPVVPEKGDTLVQYAFIPRGTEVDHLTLMVRGNGEWRYHAVWGNFDHQELTDSGVRLWLAKDMHQMAWGTIGIGFCGPQGHDIRHPMLLKHTFTEEQFHPIGDLPVPGKWTRLEVPAKTLGLVGLVVDGFGFVSKGGKVWWERTLLLRDGKEIVLCDGSVGNSPDQLESVRFSVDGLKAGTKVKVCFEERDIVAQDGYFEDDLSGEPGYRNLWVGLYGDKIGETGYYGDGVFYNYNWGKVATRLYEIPR